mmetsp:Transcript_34092/g.45069  ORF Transcript_34092/g.45069 Transcript_34092/m.45069 type:complete len:292 (-) Transcript_34092:212-1087(-)
MDDKKKRLLAELDSLFTDQPKQPKQPKLLPAPALSEGLGSSPSIHHLASSPSLARSRSNKRKDQPSPSPSRRAGKHPIYDPLPREVILMGGDVVKGIEEMNVSDLMEGTLDQKFAAKLPQLIEKKIAGKSIMLDNAYSQVQHQKAARREEIERKRNLIKWSKKQRKNFHNQEDGSKKKKKKFQDYKALNSLWVSYMRETVDSCSGDKKKSLSNKVLKADLHGCLMKIAESKVSSLLHKQGILIKETEDIFKIITDQNQILCIPKQTSKFAFQVGSQTFIMDGQSRQNVNRK